MIGIKTDTRGLFELRVAASSLERDLRDMIKATAREYSALVAAELSRPKSGRMYGTKTGISRYRAVRKRVTLFGGVRRTVTRKIKLKSMTVGPYRASRPGEAPAVFSGNLLRGLRIAFPSREKGFGAKVFSRKGLANHRHLLEFGAGPAKKGRRIGAGGYRLPRPIWGPMQRRAMADLERRVLRLIDASAAFRR